MTNSTVFFCLSLYSSYITRIPISLSSHPNICIKTPLVQRPVQSFLLSSSLCLCLSGLTALHSTLPFLGSSQQIYHYPAPISSLFYFSSTDDIMSNARLQSFLHTSHFLLMFPSLIKPPLWSTTSTISLQHFALFPAIFQISSCHIFLP